MRAIILALAERERNETQGERKENEKDSTAFTNAKKDEREKRASDVDALLLFKPLLQYAIESVQKCASLATSCVVCVAKEDAQFAKALCEKMTRTCASSSSLPSSSSSNKSATTLTTTTEKKMTFEVLEVEGKGLSLIHI